MFDIATRPDLLNLNALFLTGGFLAVCYLFGVLWKRYMHFSGRFVIIMLALFSFVYVCCMIVGPPVDHDEIEHAHAAWQMSQGLLPFNDFFQHHSPVFWILIESKPRIPLARSISSSIT